MLTPEQKEALGKMCYEGQFKRNGNVVCGFVPWEAKTGKESYTAAALAVLNSPEGRAYVLGELREKFAASLTREEIDVLLTALRSYSWARRPDERFSSLDPDVEKWIDPVRTKLESMRESAK